MAQPRPDDGRPERLNSGPAEESSLAGPAGLLATLAVLFLAARANYPFYRTVAELYSVFIALGVFTLYWNVRDRAVGGFLALLAVAYLCVGTVDLLHLLALERGETARGLAGGRNAGGQLWLLARMIEAASLVAAAWLARRRVSDLAVAGTYALFFALAVPAISIWRVFPDVYVNGTSTAFRVAAQWAICTLLVGAAVAFWVNRQRFDRWVYRMLLLSVGLTLVSELLLATHLAGLGRSEVLGYAFKVMSFFFIYKAVIQTGITRPYVLLTGDLKRTERMVELERTRLAAVLEQMPTGVIVFEPDRGIVLAANTRATSLWGCPIGRDTALERYLGPLKPVEGAESSTGGAELVSALTTDCRAVIQREYRLATPEGAERTLLLSAAPVRGPHGELAAGVVTVQDVTSHARRRREMGSAYRRLEQRISERARELRQANEELRRQEQERQKAEAKAREAGRFAENIVQTVREGLIVTDGDGTILSANPAFCIMVGKPSSRVVGRRIDQLGTGRGMPDDVARQIRSVVARGDEFTGFETPFEGASGGTRWLALGGAPFRSQNTGDDRYVITFDDVTHRKEAEERIMAYQDELRSLARELTMAEERERLRIAGDLHDGIAQYLATANLELGLLREDVDGPDALERLQTVREAVAEALEQTRSLSFDLSPMCLHSEGLDAAVRWFGDQLEDRHGLTVEVSSPEFRGRLDEDVAALLYRVVRELLLNVVKHAQATRADVSIQQEDDGIMVKVSDDGQGFDVSTLQQMPMKLRGFGLFNVRERLSDLGGSMEIESTPGHGTDVTIRVPHADIGRKEGISP